MTVYSSGLGTDRIFCYSRFVKLEILFHHISVAINSNTLQQRLHEIMVQKIIPEFDISEQEELKLAAKTWRLPYWDWAQRKPDWTAPTDPLKYGNNVPYVITLPEVEIRTSTGTSTIPNPLWKFSMPGVGANEHEMGDYGITAINAYHVRYGLLSQKVREAAFDEL